MSKRSSVHSVHSMTGYGSAEGELGGFTLKIEIKALNHRYLDIKVRLPREISSAEIPLRAALQARFNRGTLDVKVEKLNAPALSMGVQPNLSLAASYYESLLSIQKTLGLSDAIRTMDLASLPDVLVQATSEFPGEEAWEHLRPLAESAIDRLAEMRAHEGTALKDALLAAIEALEQKLGFLRQRREECQDAYRAKIHDRIKSVFEAYPMTESSAQAVLESRVAQELAILLDRTDIEEELTRFKGHLDHARKVLENGGTIGRKLDFILQEMNREVNTLGNKAQDLAISEEVIQLKVRLEQLREQVMNLE